MSLLSDDDIQIINSSTKFKMQYPEFRYSTTIDILENVLLPEIKSSMLALGYSQKIIDGTIVKIGSVNESGDVEYEVISDYTTVFALFFCKLISDIVQIFSNIFFLSFCNQYHKLNLEYCRVSQTHG